MKPVKRFAGNKHHQARAFKHQARRTHPKNLKAGPMRGGIRL